MSQMARIVYILWLINIHIFIYSSTVGHSACFQISAIINNAAVITGVHIAFHISVLFSSDKYPEVEMKL